MPGLDRAVISRADPSRLFRRIQSDSQTDLVVAPHYDHLFAHGCDQLWTKVVSLLESGEYEPDLPILMSIPKPRGFNRPGGIVHPLDRVIYQMLGDEVGPKIESALSRQRVFSTVLLDPDPDAAMFVRHGESYASFQDALSSLCKRSRALVKIDIANYYERLPQHSLINMLHDIGCDPPGVNLLEKMLLAFRQNQSVGIVQGLCPSDLLGNFYLSSFDSQCDLNDTPSVRFVDDIYLGTRNYSSARSLLTWRLKSCARIASILTKLRAVTTQLVTFKVRSLRLKTCS